MKYLSFTFVASLLVFGAQQGFAQRAPTGQAKAAVSDGANRQVLTLTNQKLGLLAEGKGEWIHFAAFAMQGKSQHLLCRKKREQQRPTCVVTTPKGDFLLKRVAFGRYKGGYAVGFRVSSEKSDLWLPMRLQASPSRPGTSPTTRSDSDSFGGAFGQDFSGVKVPGGGDAADVAGQIGSEGFTNGKGIALGGQTSSDNDLVSHEAQHIVTASSGGGDGSSGTTGGGDTSSGDSSSGGENAGSTGSGSTGSGSTGSGSTGSGSTGSGSTGSN